MTSFLTMVSDTYKGNVSSGNSAQRCDTVFPDFGEDQSRFYKSAHRHIVFTDNRAPSLRNFRGPRMEGVVLA